MDERAAWLGIGLNQEVWRYCRHISDRDVIGLYTKTPVQMAQVLRVGEETAAHILTVLRKTDLQAQERKLTKLGIDFITRAEKAYPTSLKQIHDPPAVLFIKGSLQSVNQHVAIVGSRKCTEYGRMVAQEMGAALAEAGITIVSGMARGIDTAAHKGALKTGRTIAVFGSGVENVYPPENRELAVKISQAGALISEYPPGTSVRPLNFPARNRIISGLSKVLVIVEASRKSGALITADFALEQGKDIMVVPGSVRSATSGGCHRLIKEGAAVAESADDVLELLGLEAGTSPEMQLELSAQEVRLLSLIDYYKTHVDMIIERDGRENLEILSELTLMEARGLVCRHAGGWYSRTK
ncbi:MAG TPA: DNA-protecting protein DprA [Actinobacteria bacterium]|nr:DNA-protecting protein DprA [Actinomycetota bacterium]